MPPKIVNVVSTRGSDRRLQTSAAVGLVSYYGRPFVDGGYERRTPSKEFLTVVLGKVFDRSINSEATRRFLNG